MRIFIIFALSAFLWLTGCDLAQETSDDVAKSGEGATGVAEKMSKGTLGDELDDE